eukprot:CAMPEP_0118884470 /NCGR_PEP_ID=MMETSP1163-20130328/23286_1 /TAXON_ID=124430 /ORGANISM="Phaeomonas parva, Strain CCMP2877" /LENGTH=185 /DNA_ID=CAMNT_0006822261 /DNA_START=169 /DNA_END=726 /DNA_ORIENTATION=+
MSGVICLGPICIPWVSVYALVVFLSKLAFDWYQRFTGATKTIDAKKAGAALRSQGATAPRGKRQRAGDGAGEIDKEVSVSGVETEEDWEELLGKDSDGKAVLVQFTAGWCKPCQRMKPFVGRLSQLYPEVSFGVVDVENDDLFEVVQNQGLGALPYFVAYKGGKSVDSYSGSDEETLERLLAVFQ